MNREIKFRAYGKNSKEFILNDGQQGLTFKNIQSLEDLDGWEFQQYTGLKDRNGKEIYEGDVLSGEAPVTVKFRSGMFFVEPEENKVLPVSAVAPFAEVIGNIFQSPELVK